MEQAKQEHHTKRKENKKTGYWTSFFKVLYTIATFPARCFHVIASARTTILQVINSGAKRALFRGYSSQTPTAPPPISEPTFQFAQFAHKIVEGLEKANQFVIPLAVTVDAARIGKEAYKEGSFGRETARLTSGIGGSWLGSYIGGFGGGTGGTQLGALVSFLGGPAVAVAVGSVAGGFIGSILGSLGGTKSATRIFDKLSANPDEEGYASKKNGVQHIQDSG